MKSVGRGVALSLLSSMNCDVARPISDWRWDLLQNDKEREIMVDHYTKLKAQEVKYVKEMDAIEQQRKQEMERVLQVKLFDESQYDNKILSRNKEIKELTDELESIKANPRYFKPKSLTKRRKMLSKKAFLRNQESRTIELQRVLLQDRNDNRQQEKRLSDFQMEKRAELQKAKMATTEINKLVTDSEKELANIRAVSARNLTQKESEKSRQQELERESEMAHYRAIEAHTKQHLERLRAMTETPGWQIRAHQFLNTGLLALTLAVTALVLPGLFKVCSDMVKFQGIPLSKNAFTEKSNAIWAEIVQRVRSTCLQIS
eukprot:TRINITY_DN4366_c5_g1_i1.p1 TRINITY_DN4366_c5_g1~~TRINITY_DN4366_c5_g1_i1.p1  ORF type:complete len:317 (+),score=67.42 TRINITY_DN4366_c5_g1_i1:86-1036(+)